MLEESQNPLHDMLTPYEGTQQEGTASIPSEETPQGEAPKEGENSEAHSDDEKKSDGEEGEPFFKEGEQVFKTKEEFIAHYHKRLGGASKVAAERNALKARLDQLVDENGNLKASNHDGEKKGDETQTVVTQEVKDALNVLKEAGVITSDVLDEKLKRFEKLATRFEQEEISQAAVHVEQFLTANPDAHELIDPLRETLIKMEKVGIPGDIATAYFIVTGKMPSNTSPSEQKKIVKDIKAAQAGGASSNASSAAAKSQGDMMDRILNA